MAGSSTKALMRALDLRLSEVLRLDLPMGLVGGIGGLYLALRDWASFSAVLPLSVGAVGVVIGSVIAGMALQTAFMDGAFLRKLREVEYSPLFFLAPLLFTGVGGVAASLFALVAATITDTASQWVHGPLGFITSFLSFWTLASLVPALATLVEFVELKNEASLVPDDFQEQSTDDAHAAGKR